MLTLGLSGGLDLLDQDRRYLFPLGSYHDSAAALVDDGRVVAAVEEERLNRIKHTSKGAISAIRFCLDRRCAQLRDLDALVIYGDEHLWERTLRGIYVTQVHAAPVMTPRGLVHQMLVRGLGSDIDDSKLVFVRHHLAHALSTYLQSGFESSLVLTIDGGGDDLSGSMTDASDGSMRTLQTFSMVQSLGFFYTSVVAFLGFGLHEEYKVMGLAPYGNPRKYRSQFQSLYELHPQGNYVIRWDRFPALTEIGMPRKKGEPITEFHQDVAAALQEALEHIVAHVLTHYRWLTQHRRLCMAGGVAHNCSLNGKILYSGLFDEVFVHPASHDAGCAIGAALYPFTGEPGRSIGADAGSAAGNAVSIRSVPNRTALEHVYWGPDIGTADAIRQELAEWGDVIECEWPDDISARAARLLADGSVIGWARGASEFGPRALGNRSILADPRPAENREIVNRMVKKREAFRPFAPAVLEEFANEYFELPSEELRLPFMIFVVPVRPEKRGVLGATTHVDGTARVQTVSRNVNPGFWALIEAFRQLTGVPVLLNTSFNNHFEPIVESVADVITCFLTTGLRYLVVGDCLVAKRNMSPSCLAGLVPSLPTYARLITTRHSTALSPSITHEMGNTYNEQLNVQISGEAAAVLAQADGTRTLADLIGAPGPDDQRAQVLDEIADLWGRRVLRLRPMASRT